MLGFWWFLNSQNVWESAIGGTSERTVNFQAPETFRVSAQDHPMHPIDRMVTSKDS